MTKAGVKAVDAYIAKQRTDLQAVLKRVRHIIRKTLPGAEETLSYQIPAYRLHGEYVVYFAGWSQHWSLYPVTERTQAAVGSGLAPYKVSKGTVRFPLAEPVPESLVVRIVRALAKAAKARAGSRAASPAKRAQGGRRTTRRS